MRHHLFSVIMVAMLAAFVEFVVIQQGDAAEIGPATTPGSPAAPKPAVAATPAPEPPPPLKRTLRTVALGWELLAPGALTSEAANGKPSAYKAAGLETSFTSAATMDDIASALAKGGGESGGADIAIVPLASYVAAYERLRALAPEIVF